MYPNRPGARSTTTTTATSTCRSSRALIDDVGFSGGVER
jgi:hypothetical protein